MKSSFSDELRDLQIQWLSKIKCEDEANRLFRELNTAFPDNPTVLLTQAKRLYEKVCDLLFEYVIHVI